MLIQARDDIGAIYFMCNGIIHLVAWLYWWMPGYSVRGHIGNARDAYAGQAYVIVIVIVTGTCKA